MITLKDLIQVMKIKQRLNELDDEMFDFKPEFEEQIELYEAMKEEKEMLEWDLELTVDSDEYAEFTSKERIRINNIEDSLKALPWKNTRLLEIQLKEAKEILSYN